MRRDARFCSGRCRAAERYTRLAAEGAYQQTPYRPVHARTATCPECGVEFEHRHGNRKYCSKACGDAASMQTVLDRRKAARRAAAEVDPRRRCTYCGTEIAYSIRDRPACRGCGPIRAQDEARVAARRRRAERKLARAATGTRGRWPVTEGACGSCGERFTYPQQGPHVGRYCSTRCADRVSSRKRLMWKTSNRVKREWPGVFVEHIDRDVVFERDCWVCGICQELIVRNVSVPHPLAATVDHIVALAAGGMHEYANVQAAHFLCNSTKRDLPLALALASA